MASIFLHSFAFSFKSSGIRLAHKLKVSLVRQMATSISSGEAGTTDFRVFFKEEDKDISPWHDIPLKADGLFNFVNEIPKYTKVISNVL